MADVDTARSIQGSRRVYIIETKGGGPTGWVYADRLSPAPYHGDGWWYVHLTDSVSTRPVIGRLP